MRQRISFFPRPESPVNPALLHLSDASLVGPSIEATREDRVTLTLDELPPELADVLHALDVLSVRWASPQPFQTVSPFYARLPPGLHALYTPKDEALSTPDPARSRDVCSLLQWLFQVECEDASSLQLQGDRLASSSPARQYYAPLDNLDALADHVRTQWCPAAAGRPCPLQPDLVARAASLDLSYDAVSNTLRVSTFWPLAEQTVHVTSLPGVRTEVGFLAADAPQTLASYELGMAGHVAVLGQDAHLSPVMFGFPSRHRLAGTPLGPSGPSGPSPPSSSSSSFSAQFLDPTGLHPTLQLRVTSAPPPRRRSDADDPSCRLHAYLTLPRHIFADQYQLSDPLFLASKNLSALRHSTSPVDLEAPDWAVSPWGSAVLLELAPPALDQVDAAQTPPSWTAEIPLHLRYLLPADGGYRDVDVPYPAVFWACTDVLDGSTGGADFSQNPFDRRHLGYDGLFGPQTEFWHVTPHPSWAATSDSAGRLTNTLRVPVLDSRRHAGLDMVTAAVILAGFSWVLWKLLAVYLGSGYGRAAPPQQETTLERQKKTQ